MLSYRWRCYLQSIKLAQFAAYTAAFFVSFVLLLDEHRAGFFAENGHNTALHLYILLALAGIYIVTSRLFSSHESFNIPSTQDNLLYTIVASFIVCAILCLCTYIYSSSLTLQQPLLFLLTAPIFFLPIQMLINLVVRLFLKRPSNQRHVLIIGTNPRAVEFSNCVNRQTFLGIKVMGFIDDVQWEGASINRIGTLDDFRRIIREHVVDAVVIHLPVRSFYDKICEIIEVAEEQGISTYYLNNLFEPKGSSVKAQMLGSISTIVFYSSPLASWKMLLKRLFDIAAALILGILTLPIMLAAAVAILVQDYGPIFYTQRRVGYRKREFTMYKFRSMYTNAQDQQDALDAKNEMDGPVFKIKNDPRIFPVGRFLRKHSIDELPQLYNVLKGDISFVGPRPLPLRDYRGFEEDWLRRRFSVRPGITCYWQCRVNRNEMPFEEWMRLDMEYIDNWSLWEDIKVCFKTARVVLSGQGV